MQSQHNILMQPKNPHHTLCPKYTIGIVLSFHQKHIQSAFLPNQNEFLNAIAAKPIDATKKPPRHTLPKVFDISP
ncbi:hypothetical protein L3Y34_004007 [Caenorhabditis briggsae]|uniref:Uncharacterized protein n=1 Tax=Caenorhabditis briggsae TaxID=6238 RepID=A0AAE9AE91_CAEBR|nr:hypothetical protein L3Y34_004007 [Caenorhabditis briggsae]